ncbi:molybdopterin synthase sulfur carrier subunit [Bacterioplanes sanyensis]|uniref:Molybdopterin synthase sulfur carrier subunit n=1 Tax=Bacterioplanes sanyensis TaxID=1249553 RepID=A0A222FIA6_9GAMM|nr:MoaD/ThiS family protein [Bacterioplanes sanyensis]ASP38151.1 molybdopterin synthase sulfur carrier subunit [Bacterioplanes sanyensis]
MKVLFFASLRESLACEQLEASAVSVAELRQQLQQQWPSQSHLLAQGQALVAVNQQLCHDDATTLTDDDEVAFFPPMTGG